jgi:hypothetical protein
MAIANNNIVPGQCAEYCASAVMPIIPYPIEYNIHMNARMTGYHFNMKLFIFGLFVDCNKNKTEIR